MHSNKILKFLECIELPIEATQRLKFTLKLMNLAELFRVHVAGCHGLIFEVEHDSHGSRIASVPSDRGVELLPGTTICPARRCAKPRPQKSNEDIGVLGDAPI